MIMMMMNRWRRRRPQRWLWWWRWWWRWHKRFNDSYRMNLHLQYQCWSGSFFDTLEHSWHPLKWVSSMQWTSLCSSPRNQRRKDPSEDSDCKICCRWRSWHLWSRLWWWCSPFSIPWLEPNFLGMWGCIASKSNGNSRSLDLSCWNTAVALKTNFWKFIKQWVEGFEDPVCSHFNIVLWLHIQDDDDNTSNNNNYNNNL